MCSAPLNICILMVLQADLCILCLGIVVLCFERIHEVKVSLPRHPITTNDSGCFLFIMWLSDKCRFTATKLTAGRYCRAFACPLCILSEVKDNSEGRKMIINNQSHIHCLVHGAFEERYSLSRMQSDKKMPKIWPLHYRETAGQYDTLTGNLRS